MLTVVENPNREVGGFLVRMDAPAVSKLLGSGWLCATPEGSDPNGPTTRFGIVNVHRSASVFRTVEQANAAARRAGERTPAYAEPITTQFGPINRTQYPELGYQKQGESWRVIDVATGAVTGAIYPTREALLRDLPRVAWRYGHAEPAPEKTLVMVKPNGSSGWIAENFFVLGQAYQDYCSVNGIAGENRNELSDVLNPAVIGNSGSLFVVLSRLNALGWSVVFRGN